MIRRVKQAAVRGCSPWLLQPEHSSWVGAPGNAWWGVLEVLIMLKIHISHNADSTHHLTKPLVIHLVALTAMWSALDSFQSLNLSYLIIMHRMTVWVNLSDSPTLFMILMTAWVNLSNSPNLFMTLNQMSFIPDLLFILCGRVPKSDFDIITRTNPRRGQALCLLDDASLFPIDQGCRQPSNLGLLLWCKRVQDVLWIRATRGPTIIALIGSPGILLGIVNSV